MMRVAPIFLLAFLFGQAPTEYERAISMLPNGLLNTECQNAGHNPDTKEQAELRAWLTSRYAWSIVTSAAVDRMAAFISYRGVVDFGAGNGYMSYLLAASGVDVVAIDNWSSGKPDKLWHEVRTGSYELLSGTRTRVLLLSWPPRLSPMALTALRKWDGQRLIYAGEILRGTADIPFHQELADNWHLVERIDVPQWRNRSDAIFLLERRDGAGDGFDWLHEEMAQCVIVEDASKE